MQRPHFPLLISVAAMAGFLLFMMGSQFLPPRDSTPAPINFDLLDEARSLDLIDMTLEFPEKLRGLEGRPVKLVGFMAPYDSLEDMRQCMFVPRYVGCTFCTPPKPTQVVYIHQTEKNQEEFPFIDAPSEVTGILRLPEGEDLHEGHRNGFIFVIDEAVVTPYIGTDPPTRAPSHKGTRFAHLLAPHDPISKLEEITLETLAADVSGLRELPALRPIRFERVSSEKLINRVRDEVVHSYSHETGDYFRTTLFLLGFFGNQRPDWVELISSLSLSQRVTWVGDDGELIEVLDSASTADPFTRLELVKGIADALARQHFPAARPPSYLHEDANRAKEGIRQGNMQIVAFRYARKWNISPASRPPAHIFSSFPSPKPISPTLDAWFWLPWETGPFFVEAHTGATKNLGRIDQLFRHSPETTMELFRPGVYMEKTKTKDPVPTDFANEILSEAPVFGGQFGIGGLVPWMMGSLPVDQARSISGQLLSDRYALWDLSEDGFVLLLDTRWPNPTAARRFVENVPSQPSLVVIKNPESPLTVQVILAETKTGRQRIVTALSR